MTGDCFLKWTPGGGCLLDRQLHDGVDYVVLVVFEGGDGAGFGTGGLLHHQLDVLLFDALGGDFFLVLFLFRDRLGHLVRLFLLDFFGHVLRRHFSGSLVWIFDASFAEHNPRVAAFEDFRVWHDEEERLVLAQDDSVDPLDLGESEFLHRLFCLSRARDCLDPASALPSAVSAAGAAAGVAIGGAAACTFAAGGASSTTSSTTMSSTMGSSAMGSSGTHSEVGRDRAISA